MANLLEFNRTICSDIGHGGSSVARLAGAGIRENTGTDDATRGRGEGNENTILASQMADADTGVPGENLGPAPLKGSFIHKLKLG